MRLHVLKKL
jgi:hypothetical protein